MKDLHDIASLCREFAFDGAVLAEAIRRTFKTRNTDLPAKPTVFTAEFFDDDAKKRQWAAFVNRNRAFVKEQSLEAVCREIESFLLPIVQALASDGLFQRLWPAGPMAEDSGLILLMLFSVLDCFN